LKNGKDTEGAYKDARERYARVGVDTSKALEILGGVSLSLHCWQGDDVGGFERPDSRLKGGGLQVTGNYPGKARTPEELRMDLSKACSLIPGSHRLNLHAIYGEFGGKTVSRDEIQPSHYRGWLDWARSENLGLDFNCTCFSHPLADSGLTLSHKDSGIRGFWIEHVKRCREISAYFGRELEKTCIHNLWIPDGIKDIPMDRWSHRKLLKGSLDEIFSREYSPFEMRDALESKLFGIGSESFVVGSHEFYLGYAQKTGKMVCLDLGHFHPTESIADKISAIMLFSDELLLHVSRGIRWDSDHIAVCNDELREVAGEIVRSGLLGRAHLALDYFDASMNRVGAWVIGARATLMCLLEALLEPHQQLLKAEEDGDYFSRLALREEMKTFPFGAVWDRFCEIHGVPVKTTWIEDVLEYDENVTRKRS